MPTTFSQPDASKRPDGAGPNNGRTQEKRGRDSEPRLPHDRDESSDSQTQQGPSSDVLKQAHQDVESGLVDTDKSAPMNEVYNRELRSGKGNRSPRKG